MARNLQRHAGASGQQPAHPRSHTLTRANSYDPGLPARGPRDAAGHYAAHQATDLLAGDIRQFFAPLA